MYGSDGAPDSTSSKMGVICTMMNSLPVLTKTMAMIETMLKGLLTLTLTLMKVFAQTLALFVSYAFRPMLPYLKTLAASSSGRCRSEMLS